MSWAQPTPAGRTPRWVCRRGGIRRKQQPARRRGAPSFFFPTLGMTLETIRIGAVLVVAIVAVGFDVRTRRIPNLLTFSAAILAMLVATLTGGLSATMT